MRDERQEITIVVQQRMPVPHAERRDDHVDRLPHRHAQCPKQPVMCGRLHSQRVIEHRLHRKLPKLPLYARGMRIAARALQDFQQDQVAHQDLLRDRAEQANRSGAAVAQMANPDGTVDEDQSRPSRIASRSPSHPSPVNAASASAWRCCWTRRRRPSSTVALLVERPVAVMAAASKASSISMFVRMRGGVYCLSAVYTLRSGKARGFAPGPHQRPAAFGNHGRCAAGNTCSRHTSGMATWRH